MLTKELGSVFVRTDGKGPYGRPARPFLVTLTVAMDQESIQIDNGRVVGLCGYMDARIGGKPIASMDDHPFMDFGFLDDINQYLERLGYEGGVMWSEQGMQTENTASFDCAYALYERAFPNVFRMAREALAA